MTCSASCHITRVTEPPILWGCTLQFCWCTFWCDWALRSCIFRIKTTYSCGVIVPTGWTSSLMHQQCYAVIELSKEIKHLNPTKLHSTWQYVVYTLCVLCFISLLLHWSHHDSNQQLMGASLALYTSSSPLWSSTHESLISSSQHALNTGTSLTQCVLPSVGVTSNPVGQRGLEETIKPHSECILDTDTAYSP